MPTRFSPCRKAIRPLLLHAVGSVVVLSGINLLGVRAGKTTQNLLTLVKYLGLLAIVAAGFCCSAPCRGGGNPPAPAAEPHRTWASRMIFVFFAYSGWNEMAYVSSEVRNPQKNILRALLLGTLAVAAVYIAVNLAFVHALGLRWLAAKPGRGGRRAQPEHRSPGGKAHQPADLHHRPGRDQRHGLHRRADLLRRGDRASPLRLAGPLELADRHARPGR